ncbi:MAG TPA: efflux RND transporter periplasmic adaptor subunit [Longimicrobiales bacterium]|nr:efflux RND transporter periplasmic adaptor subunit [Longimicrobiales bacterium]
MRKRTIAGTVAGVAVLAAGVAAFSVRANGSSDDVPAVTVARGDIVDRALAVGTIVPDIEVSVKSKVSGVVRRRFAEVGDFVEAGGPLLEIRPDPTPLELVEARRNLELQEIQLDNLARELARQETLQSQGLIATQQYEMTQRQHSEARLNVRMARERLALLESGRIVSGDSRVESVVRSPISGYILEKTVEVGDPVVPLSTYQEGTVLLTMADMNQLIFRGTVDEIDVGRLREGMRAEIKIGALPDARISGIVSRISLKARRAEQATTFPIEITLTDVGDAVLRAGFSANAEVIIESRTDVLIVPERVVTFSGDTAWVTVRPPAGPDERRVVRTGLSDAITIEVVDGLAEGERVLEKTRPGR